MQRHSDRRVDQKQCSNARDRKVAIKLLQLLARSFEIKGDARGDIDSRDWDTVKDAYAERVIDKIEMYAPGLRTKILGRCVLSPRDLERHNPNLVGGDSVSGSHHLMQNFVFRPFLGWSKYRTPIERLYMCGAATWPGAGVGAGSGRLLGRMLTKG